VTFSRKRFWKYKTKFILLAGSCCIPKCQKNCPKCPIHEQCVAGCKERTAGCKKEEKGFFAEVRYLQLHGKKHSISVILKMSVC
jgi:hypothetical protein